MTNVCLGNPEQSALPSPASEKLEFVHSFTIIFVLGDVIVFIIKLHYSSAIGVCVCHFSQLFAS